MIADQTAILIFIMIVQWYPAIKTMTPFDPWDNFSVGRKLDYEIIRTGVTVYERI